MIVPECVLLSSFYFLDVASLILPEIKCTCVYSIVLSLYILKGSLSILFKLLKRIITLLVTNGTKKLDL